MDWHRLIAFEGRKSPSRSAPPANAKQHARSFASRDTTITMCVETPAASLCANKPTSYFN